MSEEGRSQQLSQVEPKGAQQLDTSSTDMGIKVKVFGARGEHMIIDLCDTEEQLRSITVRQLEEKIAKKLDRHPYELRLVHCGQCREDSALLSQCGVTHMSEIYVVLLLIGGGRGGGGIGGMGDKDGKNQSMENLMLM